MPTIRITRKKDGTKRFHAIVRKVGYAPIAGTFRTERDAVRWAVETETQLERGRYFDSVEAERHTLSDAIERYIALEVPKKARKAPDALAQLRWWQREIGSSRLSELRAPALAAARDKLLAMPTARGKPRKPATVNRYLAALSHVLTVAVKDWAWLQDSPMHRLRKLKEPRGRVRNLSDAERDRLLDACSRSHDPLLYPAVVLAVATGMRRGELLAIRWSDIDWDRRRIVLHDTKNGERRSVPLAGRAYQALNALGGHRSDGEIVFASSKPGFEGKPKDFGRAWDAALREAELKDFRFHDLRHTCASFLARDGATLLEIAEVLGHKTLAMVRRYAHLADSHTSAVVERMNARFLPEEEARHD